MLATSHRSKCILSTTLMFAIVAAVPAFGSDVAAGLKHYNQGRFEDARKEFQRALAKNQEDPRLHYCLANSLMRLKKVKEAMREYHLCIHYGTGTIIAEEAETAINTYEQHAQPFDREKAAAEKKEAQLRKEEEQRQQAAELIHRQAREHAGLRQAEIEGQRNVILSRASENAKKVRDEGEEAANNLPYLYRRRYYARQTAADIRRQAQEEANSLLNKAKQQAEGYDRDAKEREARMSESESNLNDQMLRPVGGGKIRLVPEGTSLYIRNYR